MRKLITALAAAATILVGSSIVWKAEAAMLTGARCLSPLAKNSSPVEKVACWCGRYRCACGRVYHPYYHRYYRY